MAWKSAHAPSMHHWVVRQSSFSLLAVAFSTIFVAPADTAVITVTNLAPVPAVTSLGSCDPEQYVCVCSYKEARAIVLCACCLSPYVQALLLDKNYMLMLPPSSSAHM